MAQKYYPATTVRLVLIILGIVGFLLIRNNGTLYTLLFIIQLVALDLIFRESKIFYTPYYRGILISIFFYIVGALFKIMHYEGGDLMLTISFAGVALAYSLRTINKTNKTLLDYTKGLWVFSACATAFLTTMHWPYSLIGNYINLGLFAGMLILFFVSPPPTSKFEEQPSEQPFDMID